MYTSPLYVILIPRFHASTYQVTMLTFLGLTCTEQNFVTKAGAQRYASEHGIAIVAPDTSPRTSDQLHQRTLLLSSSKP